MESTAELPQRQQSFSRSNEPTRAPQREWIPASVRTCTVPIGPSSNGFSSLSMFQRFAKARILNWLSSIAWGSVELFENFSSRNPSSEQFDSQSPHGRMYIRSPAFYSSVAKSGAMGLAESYLRHDWDADDLTTVLRVLYRHYEMQERFRSPLSDIPLAMTRALERLWGNTIARSRKQIAAHYDLSNEFFELFLDPTLMYSSAYFEEPEMTLEQASTAKLRQICRRLAPKSGDHVLEIGTGWGGFGLHLTDHHDVRLTTTTISQQQYSRAKERFASSNASNRLQLLQEDYRNLSGTYDKIVSIEMIEAVGEGNLDCYFRQCGMLLKAGGRMVMQAIVMPEQRYDSYRRGVDFIQKYIFPGGFLPSITALQQAVGRTTDFRLSSIDDLTQHYARTTREWRSRFVNRLNEVRELGFDERFIRMWEYYLCYCEAAFLEQAVRVVQIAWDRPAR